MLKREDARNLQLPNCSYKLYYILGNSALGFFDNAADDLKVLQEAYRVLEHNGSFVFDLVDYNYVVEKLKNNITYSKENNQIVIRKRWNKKINGLLQTGHEEFRFTDKPLSQNFIRKEFLIPQINKVEDKFEVYLPNGNTNDGWWLLFSKKSLEKHFIHRWVYTEKQVLELLKQVGFKNFVIKKRKFNYGPEFGTMGIRSLYLAQKK